jgi:glycosyltransferase involved in cell wall biosynthesis
VLISGKDPLGLGGHESYVRAHALGAAKLGFEPHIFCVGNHAGTTSSEFGAVHRVGHAWTPVVAQSPVLARAVVAFLERRPGPHLIHGFAIWAGAGVIATRRLARRGVRATAIASAYATRAYELRAMQQGLRAHQGLRHRAHYRAWLRWVQTVDNAAEGWGYRHSELVLVNYESVHRIVVAAYGHGLELRRVPYASSRAFRPGDAGGSSPEPEQLRRLTPTDAPLVLAVSRHDPRKGLEVLLMALAELTAAGVAFRACLVGPGRLLTTHRRLAESLGLGDQVAIVGGVPDVDPYMGRADIFVLPSLAEGSGSVSVVEALAAGIAVVASACDGIPEDLTDGTNALLVPPGDVIALRDALRRLLSSPVARRRLGAHARLAHERRFSAQGFVASLESVYAEVGFGAEALRGIARLTSDDRVGHVGDVVA